MRFLALAGLLAAIPVAGAWVQGVAWLAGFGWTLQFRYADDAGVVMFYTLGLLGVAVFARMAGGVSLPRALAPYRAHRRRVLSGFLLAFGFTVAVLVLEYAVLAWLGTAAWQPSLQRWRWLLVGRILLALVSVVLIATAEECLFRGFAFNYLRGSGPPTAGAILGSAVLFALAHHLQAPTAWLSPSEWPLLIGLVLLGVLLTVVYLATGSLACAAGLHAGLLLVEIAARNRGTRFVLVTQPSWWMGTAGDLRTAPLVWAQLVVLAAFVWWIRGWARPRTAVERAPAPPGPASPRLLTVSGIMRRN